MARSSTSFQKGVVPANQGHRTPTRELYKGPVRQAERKIVDRLPALVDEMLAIAFGETEEALINHKTGETVMVPVQPQTRLKAQQYLLDRIAGKPETKKIHEAGEGLQQGFQVLLGAAAAAHWGLLAQGQQNTLPEAEVVEVPVAVQDAEARDE